MNSLAHIVTTGLGPLYDGAGHLLLSPENCVPIVALGLLAGQRGPVAAKKSLIALPIAWLVACAVGGSIGTVVAFPIASISLLILGLWVAANLPMKPAWVMGLASIIGALHGWLDGTAMRSQGTDFLGALGSTIAAMILFIVPSGIVVSLRPKWAKIGVRILGSWIAATGLLLLAWSFRK